MNNASVLSCQQLRKRYEQGGLNVDVLNGVSLEIAHGERVAIMGTSGSGKSTLLSLMAGLDVPTRGSVRLKGLDLFSYDEDQRARLRGQNMGFVFQSFQLRTHRKALENVRGPREWAGLPQTR